MRDARPGRAGLGAHRAAADRAAGRPVHGLPDLGASTRRSGPTPPRASTASACACARRARRCCASSASCRARPPRARACAAGDLLLAVDGAAGARAHRHGARRAAGAAPRARCACCMQRKGRQAARRRGARAASSRQPAVLVHDAAKGAVRVIRITRFSHGVGAGRAPRGARRAGRRARPARQPGRPDRGGRGDTVDVFLDQRPHPLVLRRPHARRESCTPTHSALPRMPLVVVVDRATASAAEIVAAALSENKRAEDRRHAHVRQGLDPGRRAGAGRRRREADGGRVPHAQRPRPARPRRAARRDRARRACSSARSPWRASLPL